SSSTAKPLIQRDTHLAGPPSARTPWGPRGRAEPPRMRRAGQRQPGVLPVGDLVHFRSAASAEEDRRRLARDVPSRLGEERTALGSDGRLVVRTAQGRQERGPGLAVL